MFSEKADVLHKHLNLTYFQALRFMVGPGHCPMISKYGPSLSKAVSLEDPSFLVMKKSHFNKNMIKYSSYSESTNSTKQKVHVGCQYSKPGLKQPLKKDKTKFLITNGSLTKVERTAECSPWSILQYFWPALSDNRSWKPIFGLLFWVVA